MKRSPVHAWVAEKTGLGLKLDPDTLGAYQLTRLKEVVAYLKGHSKYYAEALKAIEPQGLQTMADLPALPFTTAEDVRLNHADMACVSQQKIARIITLSTSGTRGPHKRLYFSEADMELCIDFFANGMKTMVSKGDKVAIFLGDDNPGGTVDLLRRGLDRIGVLAAVHGFLADAAQPPASLEADCLVGLASQLFQMAKTNPELRPKSILLCADYVPEVVVETISDLWHCEVFTHYGSTESGLGGGVQCNAHLGYHLRDADLLFEIINPKTGQPAPLGYFGEVVFTTLTREAMPLIRYRTGDISRIINTPCPCGSPLPRLDTIAGRYANLLPLAGGGAISIHRLDDIMFSLPEVLDYGAELNSGRRLHLRARLNEASDPAQLAQHIESLLRLPLSVTVTATQSPLPASHAKRIIRAF